MKSKINPARRSSKWKDRHFKMAAEHVGYVQNSKKAECDPEIIALSKLLCAFEAKIIRKLKARN